MALSDKNILITPNIGAAADPKIVFSGADASTAAQNITLTAYPTNGGTLSFDGSTGQLFSVTNSMTGTIFSVNDVSGIPSVEVLDTGLVKLAQYSGNVLIGTGTDTGLAKLQVYGGIRVSSGSTNPIHIGQNTGATTYNSISLNGVTTDSGNMGMTGGGGVDTMLYINSTGNIRFRTNSFGQTPLELSSTGALFAGKVTSGGNNGFANDVYYGAARNPIWSFGNSSTYGISYFQGAAGIGGADTIGFSVNGSITATGVNFAITPSNSYVNNNIVLHAGNYTSYSPSLTGGSASGTWGISITGNSATVGGYTPSASGGVANRVVLADGNGYIFNNYFNSSDDTGTTGTMNYIMAKFNGDNYLRSASAAKVATFLSGQTMNIVGTSTNITAYTINQDLGTGNSPTFYDVYANGGWFRNYNTNGLYNQTYGNHWYVTSDAYWNLAANNASNAGIILRTGGHQGTIRGYVYADNSNNIGFLDNTGSWKLRVVGADYSLADGTSMRAKLYYDSDDTAYYADPNSRSVFYRHNVGSSTTIGTAVLSVYAGGAGSVGWSTGLNVGDSSNYTGLIQDAGTSRWRNFGNGNWDWYNNTASVQIMTLSNGGSLFSSSDMRSPIFYDSNDTAYYGDFASTSRFNLAKVNGVYDSSITRGVIPSGAVYTTGAGAPTGAFKIKLPDGSRLLAPMLSFTVELYNYSTGTSRSFRIGGHFSGALWYNVFAYCLTDYAGSVDVRFGYDAANAMCVWIGELGTTWSYPQVFVTDFQNGYATIQESWFSGWSITLVTAFDTVTNGPYTPAMGLNSKNYNSYSPTLTGTGASGTWGINVTGSAGTAGTALNLISAAGIIQSTSSGTGYSSAIQVREASGGNASTNMIYAPRLAFHWGGTVASSIAIESSGRIGIFSNPGTSYAEFVCESSYASIFYDKDNTAYYGDFASRSSLYTWKTADTNELSWIGTSVSTGNQLGIGFNTTDTNYAIYKNAGAWTQPLNINFWVGIRLRTNPGYDYGTSFWNTDGTLQMSVGAGDNNVRVYSDIRAPIFYDYNDTAYYADPNSNSKFVNLGLGGATPDIRLSVSGDAHLSNVLYLGGTAGSVGSWGSRDYTTSGLRYFNANTYEFNNSGYGSTYTFTINASLAQHSSSVRAPIFYDSDDTTYYVDPNSTSDSALRMRGGALFGPNTTWSASLYVGGNGRVGTSATVAVTNGNLHMDGQNGYQMYLNYYSNENIYTGTGNLAVGGTSTSHKLHVYGTGYATSDFRAPIFYDSDNTAYYTNPAGASVFSDIRGNGGNLQIIAGNVGRNTKWRQLESSTDIGISFYNSADTWCMQLYANAGTDYGFLNGNWAGWDIRKVPSGNLFLNNQSTYYINGSEIYYNRVYGTTDIRSPLYYDNNDTSYYLDPASTSVLNRIDTVRTNNWLYIDANYGHSIVGAYSATRYQGVFAMGDSYKLPADGTTTGSLYGLAWSHPNAGGAAANLDSHGLLVLINGGFGCAMSYSIKASGNVTAYSDERLKTNWRNMPENYVNRLAEVKVGIYDRIDGEKITQVGVSAQSLQKLLPEAIITAADGMDTLSVAYGNAALASAVELAKEVVNLKELSNKQQTEINELKSMINMLVNKVNKLVD